MNTDGLALVLVAVIGMATATVPLYVGLLRQAKRNARGVQRVEEAVTVDDGNGGQPLSEFVAGEIQAMASRQASMDDQVTHLSKAFIDHLIGHANRDDIVFTDLTEVLKGLADRLEPTQGGRH